VHKPSRAKLWQMTIEPGALQPQEFLHESIFNKFTAVTLEPPRSGAGGSTMGSLEPLVFRARAFRMFDMGFRAMKRSAYAFLKQNECNPKNKYCSRRSRKYDQHSEKFLHYVKIHFKAHQTGLLMTV
jgi:hypothetical protein